VLDNKFLRRISGAKKEEIQNDEENYMGNFTIRTFCLTLSGRLEEG
jgi:hypothetical protein